MKNENLIRGIGEVDDRILVRYHAIDTRLARKYAQSGRMLRVLAVAACIAVLLCALVPIGMLAHPVGRAVLQRDSAALTEQLNQIEGFKVWQEQTAEKLEQTLPGGIYELLQTTPIADVLTQSQYPAYAWKGTTFGAYLQQPEMYTYYLDDTQGKLDAALEIDVTPAQYEDDDAPRTYTLTVGDEVYKLRYAYSLAQSLMHQSVHVYGLHGTNAVYVAYVDATTGECVYWENSEQMTVAPEGGVSELSMIEMTYDFLSERVRDPEAYTLYTQWEGEWFVCEYTRCFTGMYTHGGKVDPFQIEVRSCDGVTLIFNGAGNIVCYNAGYLGSLRYADTEIPVNLFDAALDHVGNFAQGYSGTGTVSRVVITPDGRLALDNGMDYLLENDTYAATAKYLTYLTEVDPELADCAYAVEPIPNGMRVMFKQTSYFATNQQTSVDIYEYDANGNVICEVLLVDGVEQMRITYTYDEQGRMIESKTVSDFAPAAGGSVTYTYDAQDRLIQRDYFDYLGKPEDQVFLEYDTQGRVIKEEGSKTVYRYIYSENNSYVLWEESKTGSYASKAEYLYDAAGNCTAVRNYEGDEISSEIVYEYNERNQKISKSTFVNGELAQNSVMEYSDGKEVKTLVYRNGALVGISTPRYNQFGECIGREDVDANGKPVQSYEYEYGYLGQ